MLKRYLVVKVREEEDKKTIEEKLKEIKECCDIHHLNRHPDLGIVMKAQEIEQITNIANNEIASIPGVLGVDILSMIQG